MDQEILEEIRSRMSGLGISEQIVVVPSGQALNMTIEIRDKFGRLIRSGNPIYAYI